MNTASGNDYIDLTPDMIFSYIPYTDLWPQLDYGHYLTTDTALSVKDRVLHYIRIPRTDVASAKPRCLCPALGSSASL